MRKELTLEGIDYTIEYEVYLKTCNNSHDDNVQSDYQRATKVEISEASFVDENGLEQFVLDDELPTLEVELRDYINYSDNFNELTND